MSCSIKKPGTLGVALSGGGARGFAHIGVLKALEEHGLKPDVIAGVSAGAIVAVLYSAGMPFEEMLKLFSKTSFSDYAEFKMRGGGFFKLDRFRKHIMDAIGARYHRIEDLNIPTYLGVTNLDAGEAEVLSSGPLGDAMIASCSIPILFRPVKINGKRYVDGGVLRNVPTRVVRDKCDFLIGVNCSTLCTNDKIKDTVMDIGMRTYSLMTRFHQKEDMKLCDLAIELPEIANYRVFNLKNIREVYIRGYATAKQAIESNPLLYNE